MMIESQENKLEKTVRSVFDPLSVLLSIGLIVLVLLAVTGSHSSQELSSAILFSDLRSFFFVIGGTIGCLLFQFDLISLLKTFTLILQSLFTQPAKQTQKYIAELDEVIISGDSVYTLREGKEINGDLLNDIVHMLSSKLFYDEIENLVANNIAARFIARKTAVALLNKGAKIAPALGLLGTVIGLIDVLQSLDEPSKIGPAMSLALMTTAFGSIFGSFFFTPMAGRIEQHNILFLEANKLLMNRVKILIQREERFINPAISNKKLSHNDD